MNREQRRAIDAHKAERVKAMREDVYRRWCAIRREHGLSTTRAAFDADARAHLAEIGREQRQGAAVAMTAPALRSIARKRTIAAAVVAGVVAAGGVAGLIWWLR